MTEDEIKDAVVYINTHYCVEGDWCARTALNAIDEVRRLRAELDAWEAGRWTASEATSKICADERERCAKAAVTLLKVACSVGVLAVKAAKEEEREQCAKVVEWYEADENCGDWRLTVESMATAIRARQ